MLEIAKEKVVDSPLDFIRLKGFLNVHTAHDLTLFFQEFGSVTPSFFILEASQLKTVSSSGIAAMVRLIEDTQAGGGDFVFLHLPIEIEMLFSFLGLTKRIRVFSSKEEAIAFFSSSGHDLENKIKNKKKIEAERREEIPEVQAETASPPLTIVQSTLEDAVETACTHCGLPLRAHSVGPHMCPGCGQQFVIQLKSNKNL